MIVWVFVLSLVLIITAIPLITVGAYKKFKQKSQEDIYLILFVSGCVFIGFGLFLMILSLVSGNSKTMYYEYLPQIPYPMQLPYNFQQATQPIFKPIYENLGWTSNPE
jgi:hypothetical protein